MARYYTENMEGRIRRVVAQDETGLYNGAVCKSGTDTPSIRIIQCRQPSMLPIKFPEWPRSREVSTVSEEYLEFRRRMDRNPRFRPTPSEVKEMPGTAGEVIRKVLEEAGPKGTWIIGDASTPSALY